jgi:hypothetical protein
MFRTVLALSAIASVAAFSAMPSRKVSGLKMSAEDMVGSLAPVGFFDPLGLSSGRTGGEVRPLSPNPPLHPLPPPPP